MNRSRATTIAGFVALLVIYGPLVARDPILTRDDHSLLDPLRSVRSAEDYLRARSEHRILDLQPVRDASYIVDMALGRVVGHSTFHATNLLLWFLIVALAGLLAREVGSDSALIPPALLAFAVHPVFVGSVGWISARKHLLACAFILGATLIWERVRRRDQVGFRSAAFVVVHYSAAVLSQPIVVLWPLWLLVRRPTTRAMWLPAALCLAIMAGTVVMNLGYYGGEYQEATPVAKLATGGHAAMGLFALGRYMANLFWPFHLATIYAPGHALEWVGLALFILLATLAVWRREALPWLAFFLFPLAVVTVRMTNIYVSDTYVLTSAVGLLCLLLVLARALNGRVRMGIGVGLVLAALIETRLSVAQAATWMSDGALWEQAFRESPTPTTAAKHAFYLARAGHRDEARTVLASIPEEELIGEVGHVAAQVAYEDPKLGRDEKRGQLAALPLSPWRNYYLAALNAGDARFAESWALMQEAFSIGPRFGSDLPTIAAESEFFCRRAGASGCGAFVEQLRHHRDWNEGAYARRAAALN